MRKLLVLLCAAGALISPACKKTESAGNVKQQAENSTKKNMAVTDHQLIGETVVNGAYRFVTNGTYSSTLQKVISVVGNATIAGAQMHQWQDKTGNGQKFKAVSVGTDIFRILNVNSGLSLGLSGTAATENAPIIQEAYTGATDQIWQITDEGSGKYRIKLASAPTMGMHLTSASTADGIIIRLKAFVGTASTSYFNIYRVAYDTKTTYFSSSTGLTAMDGAYSVPMTGSKTLWVFGDSNTSYDNGAVHCFPDVGSAALLQPLSNWSRSASTTLLGAGNTKLFWWDTVPSHFVWPAAGIELSGVAYVLCNLYNKIDTDGNGSLDGYEQVGMYWTRLNNSGTILSKVSLPYSAAAAIAWGNALVDGGDGYIYVYGAKLNFAIYDMHVARFAVGSPTVWQYWNGSSFQSSVSASQRIGYNLYGMNVAKIGSKYVLFNRVGYPGCDEDNTLSVGVSSNPTGPFGDGLGFKKVFKPIETLNGHTPVTYLYLSHPEYINTTNEILVTYCVNGYGGCEPTCLGNWRGAEFYRPRAIRVPLKMLDPSL